MKKPLLALVFCAMSIMVLAPLEAGASQCEESKIIDRTFDASDFSALELKALAGYLEVTPSTGSEIHFWARACTSDQEYLDMMDLDVIETQDQLKLAAIIPWHQEDFEPRYASMDIELSLPANLPLRVKDSSGDMLIEGVSVTKIEDSSGEIRVTGGLTDLVIRDSSGDINVSELTGSVRVSDSSGDIRLRNIEQDVEIPGDSSGSIDIRRVKGSVRVDSDGSGDIEIDDVGMDVSIGSDGSGDIEIEDVRGRVVIQADGSGSISVGEVAGSFDVHNKGAGRIRTFKIDGEINIPN
jgi:hypothetical protein